MNKNTEIRSPFEEFFLLLFLPIKTSKQKIPIN